MQDFCDYAFTSSYSRPNAFVLFVFVQLRSDIVAFVITFYIQNW